MNLKLLALLCVSMLCGSLFAQRNLPLVDMSNFEDQAGNWQIVGKVMMNPEIDIHHQEMPKPQPAPEAIKGKKKKKKKKKVATLPPPPPPPKAVMFEGGKGILLNMNTDSKKDHLLTKWTHGDMEFECDVMLPKGSNSGIYLQGRYEIQLFDSWGVKNPAFSDIGGIYRNWENTPGKIYRGKAPASNPAKAPGLWQHIHLLFRAPKFDEKGNKIANAKLDFVDLNGTRIHQHVEIPLPTGGPIEKNEVAEGPLMIQGDHGPVAIRNMKITHLKNPEVFIEDVNYKVYARDFDLLKDFMDAKATSSGKIDLIDCNIAGLEDHYGMVFEGQLKVDEAGDYTFNIPFRGGVVFQLNGETIIDHQRAGSWRADKANVSLSVGTYPFTLYHYKSSGWMNPGLGLFVQKAGTYEKPLHAYDSWPTSKRMVSQIYVDAGKGPRMLRAFLDFKGDRKRRLTHNVGVGDPSGLNYVYDLKRQNLVCVWRGDFVNATPMWHDRGDGSFRPRGAALYTFTDQPLAMGTAEEASFPKMGLEHNIRPQGYEIDRETNHPVFKSSLGNIHMKSAAFPDNEGKSILHKVNIQGQDSTQAVSYKLAEGSMIEKMPNGYYAVDGQNYYLKLISSHSPVIRSREGKEELVVELGDQELTYELIW